PAPWGSSTSTTSTVGGALRTAFTGLLLWGSALRRTRRRRVCARLGPPSRQQGANVGGQIDAPTYGVLERIAVVRKVEALAPHLPLVPDLVEPADHRGKVARPFRVIDVNLALPGLALTKLHVAGELQQLDRVPAPGGHVPGIEQEPQPRDLLGDGAH